MLTDVQSRKTYYGTTEYGHRIHFGEEVLYPDKDDPEKWVIVAHCTARLVEKDIEVPLPSKVDEYCKICFRALAWEAYTLKLAEVAQSKLREQRQHRSRPAAPAAPSRRRLSVVGA